jgi:hypothetical protein
MCSPGVSPAIDFKNVEHPLPGLPKTSSISPWSTIPQKSCKIWRLVEACCRKRRETSRGTASRLEAAVCWYSSSELSPNTLSMRNATPGCVGGASAWAIELLRREYSVVACLQCTFEKGKGSLRRSAAESSCCQARADPVMPLERFHHLERRHQRRRSRAVFKRHGQGKSVFIRYCCVLLRLSNTHEKAGLGTVDPPAIFLSFLERNTTC